MFRCSLVIKSWFYLSSFNISNNQDALNIVYYLENFSVVW